MRISLLRPRLFRAACVSGKWCEVTQYKSEKLRLGSSSTRIVHYSLALSTSVSIKVLDTTGNQSQHGAPRWYLIEITHLHLGSKSRFPNLTCPVAVVRPITIVLHFPVPL